MSNNIVVLSGSPRAGANTDKLVAAFVEGAEAAGKSVKLYRVADMQIGGCRGCGHCHGNGGDCVQKDDMLPILDALREADAMVLASPVYYFNVTAQLKLAIDRTYALLRQKTPIQKAALLMTCGNGDASVAESSLAMFKMICRIQHFEEAGAIIAPGLHGQDEILGRPELDQARALGKEI